MSILMVDDPDFKGKVSGGAVPQIPRAWAMRKLFKEGMSIGDIGRRYSVSYAMAYKSINPPRQSVESPTSTAAKPLTTKRLGSLTKAQLEKIAYMKQKSITTPAIQARVQAAADELERRGLL